jgi:hypothetical protein
MATRAMIGMMLLGGKIRTVYSHWDGYPKGVGAVLFEHYRTEKDVAELLSHGDISSLESSIEKTDFYGDRGGPREFDSLSEAIDYYRDSFCEYIYIFNYDDWLMYDRGCTGPLSEVLKETSDDSK